MRIGAVLLLLAVFFATSAAFAVEPGEVLKDPVLEQRARNLSAGLRCLVCQNQSIDDSQAPLAHDLRMIVRERLEAGDSDAAVRDYVVGRYGDFVLLKPPLKPATLVLWATPFLLVLVGSILVLWRPRSRVESSVPPLSPEEQARITALLEKPGQ